ncbi:MAG: WD40/YVTN/BNR-like repeat-containing protein [Terracidiphilus sp.]
MMRLSSFSLKRRRNEVPALLLLLFLCLPVLRAQQARWTVLGPDGGDARAFASVPGEPQHLYLGTTNSWLYESFDEGATWHRLAKLDRSDGFVIDNILVDSAHPKTLYVGAWKDPSDGGVWTSYDAGRTWTETPYLKGQPVFALAQAPSDPSVLYAGTLKGVYRSGNSGATWSLISPAGSREIHEIESLAIDPRDANVVYAGTWHLPWKTMNGGKSWRNIKRGLIVDSDVFSIIVDPVHPRTVYLSACSGIYKSEDAGLLFHKIQGIPNEARRTRVIMQDPENREIVYAGTTEGLYKTENAGRTFRRMTGSDVVINDVYVDPTNSRRVLLATDRGGVLVSDDGGGTFTPSNTGISERKIAALLVDRNDPRSLYAGVVNDKQFGGVFHSTDSGAHWQQLDAGLDGRDVFSLAQSKDGTIVAGTSHGIFVLPAGDPPAAGSVSDDALVWQPRNDIANLRVKAAVERLHGTRVNVEKQVSDPVIQLESLVNAVDASGDVWVAATDYGVLTSSDQGASWQGGPVMDQGDFISVTAHGKEMVAARDSNVVISHDSGSSWWPMGTPIALTHIHRVTFSPDGTLWLGAHEGVYFTRNLGKNWFWIQRLPLGNVDDLSYDPVSGRVLASSRRVDQVFAIDPRTITWVSWQAGYQIDLIRAAGGRLVAASLNDGVILGPRVPPAPHRNDR